MPEKSFAEEGRARTADCGAIAISRARCCRSSMPCRRRFGYVDDAAVPIIAKALNLSRAEVHGVLTFYHDFRRQPAGRHVLRLCRAEACQSMGCEKLAEGLRARLGIDFGGTTPDGRLTLETVYCLGNCALSPAAMLDGRLHGRLDERRLEALLAADGAPLDGGPGLSCRAIPPPSPWAPTMSRPPSSAKPPARGARHRSGAQRQPRAVLAGADGRGGDAGGPRRLWPGRRRRDVAGLVRMPASSRAARIALASGPTEEIPYLKRQERLTFARCGITDPLSLDDYEAHGGFAGLKQALALEPAAIVEQVTRSGLRGRGGAGFPAGIKWKTVLGAEADAEIHRLQRRRGRQRHLRRPHADGRRSLLPDRGHDHRRHRRGRERGLHLYPLRISPCLPPDGARRRDRARRRLARRRMSRAAASPSTSSFAWAPGPISAARRPRCWRASKASAASSATSRRCRRSRACSASPRSSTTSSRWPACRSSWPGARTSIATTASAARAARCRSSSPAMSSAAGWSRRPSASRCAS